MKKTLKKIRLVIRRSSITKHIITALLIGAGFLAFMVICGEDEPGMSFAEFALIKVIAFAILGLAILLGKVAYRSHLLTDSFYFNEKWA